MTLPGDAVNSRTSTFKSGLNQPVAVAIDPAKVIDRFDYDHPVFDLDAIQAQRQIPQLQGLQHTWFAGAWMGYGFHEDGLKAGRAAANGILTLIHQQAAA